MKNNVQEIRAKIDPIFKIWSESTDEKDFIKNLNDNGYNNIVTSQTENAKVLPNSIVFTPEDDPSDYSFYTPDGDKLIPITMENIYDLEPLEKEDEGDLGYGYWNVDTLVKYFEDFSSVTLSIVLK